MNNWNKGLLVGVVIAALGLLLWGWYVNFVDKVLLNQQVNWLNHENDLLRDKTDFVSGQNNFLANQNQVLLTQNGQIVADNNSLKQQLYMNITPDERNPIGF